MALVLNGRPFTRPVTGVGRYGRSLLPLIALEWPDARIVVPRSTGHIDACGLDVVRRGIGNGHWWEQSALPSALGRNDVLLSTANTGPLRVRRQVLVLHDLAFLHHPEWFDRRFAAWYGFLLPRLARRCAHVIAVSGSVQREIQATFMLPDDRLSVVPPFLAEPPAAQRTGERSGRPYLLLVGAHDPRKGAERVLAWYRGLNAPAFDLVLVGRPHRAFTPPVLPAHPGVEVLTDVDDARLWSLYAEALALVHASAYEGFGLPVLEALACGCPVIAHDLPVLREQFGDAPWYIDMGDPASLGTAIAGLAEPTVRAAHIARGQARAATFTAERTLRALRSALLPLLSG